MAGRRPARARDRAARRRRSERRRPYAPGSHARGRAIDGRNRAGRALARQARACGRPLARRRARAPRRGRGVPGAARGDGRHGRAPHARSPGTRLLEQAVLPRREVERDYTRWEDVADAIRTLVVRGAPAIGVAAAYGVVLAARQSGATTFDGLLADLETAIKGLAATRPTAVNLFWALDRMRRRAVTLPAQSLDAIRARLLAEAEAIRAEDIEANHAMGAHGATLVPPGARILTHCNAGALATAGYRTALGVMRAAHERGKVALVWVDETRPGMQGARLTAWQCVAEAIPPR